MNAAARGVTIKTKPLDAITAQVEREGTVGRLQEQYARLYEIIHYAHKYRMALRIAIRELSVGGDQRSALAILGRWESALRAVKRTAGKLAL